MAYWNSGWIILFGIAMLISSLAIPAAGFIPKTSPNTLSVCMGLLGFTQILYAIWLILYGMYDRVNWELYSVAEPLLGFGVLLTWLAAYLLVSLASTPDRKTQNLVMGIMSFFAAVAVFFVSGQVIIDGYYERYEGLLNITLECLAWLVIFVAATVFALRRNKYVNLSSSCLPQWQCFLMVGLTVVRNLCNYMAWQNDGPFFVIITNIL